MGEQIKIIGFATAVCLVCSLLLAVAYSGLKESIDRNKALDAKTKVLTAFGVEVFDKKSGKALMNAKKIEAVFAEQVESKVLDFAGNLTEVKIDDLENEDFSKPNKKGEKKYYPLFIYTDAKSGKTRYGIHVSGRALWSLVKGYLALEDDCSTVAGIAFYEHEETPGLGGEIEKPFFQDRFKGKVFSVDAPFRIVKPGAKTDDHSIDGITAATMTCNGVAIFLNADYLVYAKYFKTLKK